MVYSARLRKAVGQVRTALEGEGIGRQGRQFAEHGEHRPSDRAPLVLVACSGGRDSMALAAVAHVVAGSLGVRCGAVIVDHGLQRDSARIAEDARRRCGELGLDPVEVRRVEVTPAGHGMEAAAREARYHAIAAAAHELGAVLVLLAHTKNDQAETVLIDLIRSGGLDALAGMPVTGTVEGVRLLRPLLGMTRDETTGICQELAIEWWDDPTNGEDIPPDEPLPDDFPLRSRIRHSLLPYLQSFTGGDVVSRLAQGARLAGVEKAYLDGEADRAERDSVQYRQCEQADEAVIDADVLRAEHQAIRCRVLAHVLARLGLQVVATQVEAIDHLLTQWHGQAGVSLSRGYSAFRQKHVIRVCQDRTHANRRCEG